MTEEKNELLALDCLNLLNQLKFSDIKEKMMPLATTDEINTDNYISYFLEPGDAFYMSPGTVHQVVVNEPRVTVLFDFFVKNHEILPQDIWDN